MRIPKNLLFALALSVTATYVSAQQGCKVLMENIQSHYEGECKNMLAHGQGIALGIDSYTGSFRKGYPNGKGVYKWSTGEYYDGEWMMGKREGKGEYHCTVEGKEVIQNGVWKNDRYFGPEPVHPQIKLNQNISDVKFTKTGAGDEVIIKIEMARSNNPSITDLSVSANSGVEFHYGSYMGFKSIVFPFICKINYTTPNLMRTVQNRCALEFEIPEAGRWEVKIENN